MKLRQHLNQYINIENVARLVLLIFYCAHQKFNLTGGLFFCSW